MKQLKCPQEFCKKEIEKPIIVTNFSLTPHKETYYACPHCLTRIYITTTENNCTPGKTEEQTNTQKQHILDKPNLPKTDPVKKIEKLEKTKADLLAELEKLRNEAIQKLQSLEKEVANLKEEEKILKELTQKN